MEKGEQTVIWAACCSIYLAASLEVEVLSSVPFNPATKLGRRNKAAQNLAIQQFWEMLEKITTRTRLLSQA